MGEDQPVPPESNIRSEGLHLIALAKSYRTDADGTYGQRDPSPESEPPLSRAISPPIGRSVSRAPSGAGEPSRVHIRANGTSSSRSRTNGYHLAAPTITRDSTRSLTPPPPAPANDTFEQEWAKVSGVYERAAEKHENRRKQMAELAAQPQRQVVRPWDDPGDNKAPPFYPGQPATVVLDSTLEAAPRPQDRLERYELEGLSTLPEPFKQEAAKFAEHVKVSTWHLAGGE